jgi:hypothetical protein
MKNFMIFGAYLRRRYRRDAETAVAAFPRAL